MSSDCRLSRVDAAQCSEGKESMWFLDKNDNICRSKKGRIQCYTESSLIGQGIIGKIWEISSKDNRRKKTKIAKIAKYYDRNDLLNEYNISLKYPNESVGLVLRTKAYLDNGKDKKILIMHKYDCDIRGILPLMKNKDKIEAIYQIAQGLATLHDLDIVHGDIYPSNIFYDKKKRRYDIADFGGNFIDNKYFDITNFKKVVEVILIGKDEVKSIIKTKEEVLHLGYSEKVAYLIIDFMNNTPNDMKQISEIFDNVRKAFNDSEGFFSRLGDCMKYFRYRMPKTLIGSV